MTPSTFFTEDDYTRLDTCLESAIPDGAFRERAINEIALALFYVQQCNHDTSGHLSYTVINALARIVLEKDKQ